MLLAKELAQYRIDIQACIDEMVSAVMQHQQHPGDILLALNYAQYDPDVEASLSIGYDDIVHAAQEQAKFVALMRKDPNLMLRDNSYLMAHRETAGFEAVEETSIHLEMLLYLKIWEMDMYQRLLLQIARLASGLPYHWQLKIDVDTPKNIYAIVDSLNTHAPKLSLLIKQLFDRRLRNAIAHSQYFFSDQTILTIDRNGNHEANYSFDDWRASISKTLLLHSLLEVMRDKLLLCYEPLAKAGSNGFEVLLTRPDGSTALHGISPIPHKVIWGWTESLRRSGLSESS